MQSEAADVAVVAVVAAGDPAVGAARTIDGARARHLSVKAAIGIEVDPDRGTAEEAATGPWDELTGIHATPKGGVSLRQDDPALEDAASEVTLNAAPIAQRGGVSLRGTE